MPNTNPSGDYLRRLGIAEALKTQLRASYARAVRQCAGESTDAFLSRSRSFWQEYDTINTVWLPEDPVYTGTRSGVTLSTSADLFTLTAGGSAQVRILEWFIGGESTTSTVLRFAIQRSTGGTTATAQTAEKMNTRSPTATSVFATAWSAQPTLSGNPLLFSAFNTFGGTDRWVPQPGEEIYLVNGEQLSGRSQSGTPVVSAHLVWEEL